MKRRFEIILTVCAALVAAATTNARDPDVSATVAKSRVVLVRDPNVKKGLKVDADRARAMVSKGIRALTGKDDDAAAWGSLVSSDDVVGIKISTMGAPLQATRREVVDAIADGLRAAGVNATNIVVWDRDGSNMRAAGYRSNRDGPGMRILSVVPDTGWDAGVGFHNSLVGKLIWGDLLFGKEGGDFSNVSHLPKIITQTVTKLINVPVLQDHEACGISGCLYNLSLAAVDNMRRFETGGFSGDPIIGEIFKQAPIHDKVVLNLMDGLVGGYAGGPLFKQQFSWDYAGLLFSHDPVAIDMYCVELLNERRIAEKIGPIGFRASHIASAARLGLGQMDVGATDFITISP